MLEDSLFQKYVDKCGGNRFQAVRFIASLARSLASKYDNVIMYSEAITWLLTGKRPDIIDEQGYIKQQYIHKNISYTDDLLSCVDDDEVKEAVMYSITESNKQGNLVYIYKRVSDECRQARVRVLVRMIWYNTHKYK